MFDFDNIIIYTLWRESDFMSNKILVVDDETEIADLIEVYLKNENYTVF